MRRVHEGARHHGTGGAARQADRRWLRHLGHTHFRGPLGLYIGHGIGSTSFILTRRNHFGNTLPIRQRLALPFREPFALGFAE
jgi:hypothetical protein